MQLGPQVDGNLNRISRIEEKNEEFREVVPASHLLAGAFVENKKRDVFREGWAKALLTGTRLYSDVSPAAARPPEGSQT